MTATITPDRPPIDGSDPESGERSTPTGVVPSPISEPPAVSRSQLLRWTVAALVSLPTAISIGSVLTATTRGLDFTDEGMYLLSADARSDVSTFHNAFGRYTQVLFRLAGHDVARFRQIGVVLLVFAAGVAGERMCELAGRIRGYPVPGSVRLVGAAAVVSAAMHHYSILLTTPNYNWMNLVGILTMIAGFAHLLGRGRVVLKRDLVAVIGLVAGGAVAAMGKISSGPALGLIAIVLLVALLDGPWQARVRYLAPFAICAVVWATLHSLFINPLTVTAGQITRGNTALATLDPSYGLSNAVKNVVQSSVRVLRELVPQTGAAIAVAIAAAATGRRRQSQFRRASRDARNAGRSSPTITSDSTTPSLGLAISVLVLAVQLHWRGLWIGSVAGYGTLSWVGIGTIAIALVALPLALAQLRQAGRAAAASRVFAVVGFGLAGSASYAFGSGNGFFSQLHGGIAAMVAVAVVVLLLVTDSSGFALPVNALALILGVGALGVVGDARANPYRQGSISDQNVAVRIGSGKLLVGADTAETINALRRDADKAGWVPGTPLLDLSPYAATVVYLLDAKPPLTIIPSVGGYPTQQVLARWSVEKIVSTGGHDEWHNAWLLTLADPAIGGVDPDVLGLLDRSFPKDYEPVGTYELKIRSQRLTLWRPKTIEVKSP